MIGDPDDMQQRLRLTLPTHWFADVAPVLDGLLAGLSAAWSSLYALLQLAKTQTRVATATTDFLDLAATDFFGSAVARRVGETDDAFRARLLKAMRRERATRASLADAAAEAGFTISIFEAARPADTGAYNVAAGLAWNGSGGWGSLEMPLECLVVATRGPAAIDDALLPSIADSLPAGGAAWVRIATYQLKRVLVID